MYPVKNISWKDCHQFFISLSMLVPDLNLSFPTEAQWEYSCRAGSNTRYHFGESVSESQSNFGFSVKSIFSPVISGLRPVKSYAPNAWGLYEMHGNISEWCLDGLRVYPSIPNSLEIDPIGPLDAELAVIRGGAWGDSETHNSSASRDVYLIDSGSTHIGVRPCFLDGQQELIDRRYSV